MLSDQKLQGRAKFLLQIAQRLPRPRKQRSFSQTEMEKSDIAGIENEQAPVPEILIGVILGTTKTTSAPKTAARNDPITRVATSRAIWCTPAAPVGTVSFGSISVVAFIGS